MTEKDVDTALVRELAEILGDTGLTEIEIGKDDWHIRVAKEVTVSAAVATPAAAPAAVAAPAAAPVAAATADSNHPGTLTSPMVGVVYTSPDPESAPFVKVGDKVEAGQTVLIVEAMKVFNDIKATKSGTINRIFVTNGNPVEFGEPLMIIE